VEAENCCNIVILLSETLVGSGTGAYDFRQDTPVQSISPIRSRILSQSRSGVDAAEERTAANLDRIGREIRSVKTGDEGMFARGKL
jgi:hypothetical protein